MTKHLVTVAAVALLSGCAASMAQEAAASYDAAPYSAPELDGGPAPMPAPVIVARVGPPVLAPPVVVAKVVPAAVTCRISIVRTSHGVRLTPVVEVARSMSGEYSLVITKKGAGGASDITQGGPFDAPRHVKQSLGSAEISLERGASYRAVLRIRSDNGEICRREIHS